MAKEEEREFTGLYLRPRDMFGEYTRSADELRLSNTCNTVCCAYVRVRASARIVQRIGSG